jgi:hypothetical protein
MRESVKAILTVVVTDAGGSNPSERSFLRIAKLIITRDLEELQVIYDTPQYALPKGGTLKVDKLDRLPLLHIHRNQSKVRTTLHSIP